MTLNIKKAGAYSAAAGVFVKKSGVYSAAQAVFVKVAGVYQNVIGYMAANVSFDANYLTATMPSGFDSSLGSVSLWIKSNQTIAAYRFIFSSGDLVVGINDTGYFYFQVTDSSTTKSLKAVTQTLATSGHYAVEWDTSAAAGLKTVNIFLNGVSVPLTITDATAGFVGMYQFGVGVGANNSGSFVAYADVGELMFWPGTFANWAANISKVYAAGKPVDPGANGITPLGVVPKIYLSVRNSDAASAFITNRGSGPAFTKVGNTLQRADEGMITYGDSLTYGYGATQPGSTSWAPIIAHGLNRPRKLTNFGVSGATMDQIIGYMTSGNASPPILSATQSTAAFRDRLWTLEGGYNNIASGTAYLIGKANTMISTMLAADPSAKWIYIGIPTGNVSGDGANGGNGRYAIITGFNSQMASTYGANFLDINAYLLANGLSDNGLTATGTDLADIANGVVPTQIRMADNSVHWNDYGQLSVKKAVLAKMTALGYN